jgi:hypothetical protein
MVCFTGAWQCLKWCMVQCATRQCFATRHYSVLVGTEFRKFGCRYPLCENTGISPYKYLVFAIYTGFNK